MKTINKYLVAATIAIRDCKISVDGKTINDVYKGYVSSFGAMVINNGLPATLAIYLRTDGNKKGDSDKIVDAIANMLGGFELTEDEKMKNNQKDVNKPIITIGKKLLAQSCDVEKELDKSRLLKEDVIDASIALKLMMRTYRFIETDK